MRLLKINSLAYQPVSQKRKVFYLKEEEDMLKTQKVIKSFKGKKN